MAFTMIRAPSLRHFPILLQDIAFLADRVYDFISDADPPDGGCIEPEDFFFETENAPSPLSPPRWSIKSCSRFISFYQR